MGFAANVNVPLINPKWVEDYERDGVVHVKNLITPEEVELLRTAVAKQILHKDNSLTAYDFEDLQDQTFNSNSNDIDVGTSERFDIELLKFIVDLDPEVRPIRDDVSPQDDGASKAMFFHDAAGWRHHEEIRKVALHSRLPMVTNNLMRSKYTHFWEDTTFAKSPRTPQRTVFHQDWSYFQIDGEKCCIVWIALDPADEENGRMEYIRGSHRWGKVFAPSIFFAQSVNPNSPYDELPDIEGNRDAYDIVGFDCEPGDVIIHHVMTVHGSGGNKSADRPRRAMSFRYCGDDIRYFDKPGAIEQQYLTQQQENGEKLNTDDYPLVWPVVECSSQAE
jgi:ectoine hydroxylase-related dioxygenase (phytanoyl-CoA dioxygenase family)